MSVKCCVPSCQNLFVKGKSGSITFHTFPGGLSVRREWLHRIGLPERTAISQLLICSKHFREEQLVRRYNSTTLKPDALPLLALTEIKAKNIEQQDSCRVRVIQKRPRNYRVPISNCIVPLTSRVCCVRTCKKPLRRGRSFKFYRFPPERFIRSLWKLASPKNIFSNTTETAIICSAHFTSDSYESDFTRRHWLREDAAPFIFNEDYVSRKSILRKINRISLGDQSCDIVSPFQSSYSAFNPSETDPESVSSTESKLSQLLRTPISDAHSMRLRSRTVKFVCDSKLVPATSRFSIQPTIEPPIKPPTQSSSIGENPKFYLRSKYFRYLGDIKDSDLKSPFGLAKAIELVQRDAEKKYLQFVHLRRKNKRISKKIRELKQLMVDFKEAEELAARYPSMIY